MKAQGIDDALIQPYSGHEDRQSPEVYSRASLADAQQRYDVVIDRHLSALPMTRAFTLVWGS